MWFPLGFAVRLPFMLPSPAGIPSTQMSELNLKTGDDRFTPKDLIELP